MSSNITIYDSSGHPLASLDKIPTVRSWILNDLGRCTFQISTADPKCTERYVRYGNLVLVEHLVAKDVNGNSKGKLPFWVGIILPPRIWNYGLLDVTAYSAEDILFYRGMPQIGINGTAGSLFTYILGLANALGGTPIHPGNIFLGGTGTDEVLSVSAMEHIKAIALRMGHDWNVTPYLDPGGNLTLRGNYYDHMGSDTAAYLDRDNSGLESPLLTEQGILYNVIHGYSSASTTAARQDDIERDDASVSDYNVLHGNQTINGATTQAAIQSATKSFVYANSRPQYTVTPSVLDAGNIFSSLSIGNTLNYTSAISGFQGGGLGFSAKIRIVGMEYSDLANQIQLTAVI